MQFWIYQNCRTSVFAVGIDKQNPIHETGKNILSQNLLLALAIFGERNVKTYEKAPPD